MAKRAKAAPPPGRGFWIFMACCGLGAVALVALLIGGEIAGPKVAPAIEQKPR